MNAPAVRQPVPEDDRPPPTSRRGARTRGRARLGWLYTAPSLLVVLLVTIFPIVFSIVLSFTRVRITYSGFRVEELTLDNYLALLHSAEWYYSVGFTVFYTVVTVAIELVLGTVAALVLERLDVARGWLMALLLIPWAMITVISAQLWSFIYNATYGVATWFFEAVLGSAPVILGTPSTGIAGMMVADIWKTTPFVTIIVLAGLVMLPREVYESAEVDGANAWTMFWRVTLPQLKPTLAVAVLFRILQAFGVFDLPFVLTNGGPGTSTQSLAIMGYKTLFQDLNIGPGAAIATTTGLLVIISCVIFLKAFRAQVGREDLA